MYTTNYNANETFRTETNFNECVRIHFMKILVYNSSSFLLITLCDRKILSTWIKSYMLVMKWLHGAVLCADNMWCFCPFYEVGLQNITFHKNYNILPRRCMVATYKVWVGMFYMRINIYKNTFFFFQFIAIYFIWREKKLELRVHATALCIVISRQKQRLI